MYLLIHVPLNSLTLFSLVLLTCCHSLSLSLSLTRAHAESQKKKLAVKNSLWENVIIPDRFSIKGAALNDS